jgi:DNA-binding SARP family transcriptional activator
MPDVAAPDRLIRIQMLGGFALSAGGNTVSDTVGRTHQLWNLLGYLICNRHKSTSQEELIEMLWPDESSENPANALKNLVYRVRTALGSAGIDGARNMILYRRGSYYWNNGNPCLVDTEQFEQAVARATEASRSREERIALLLEAVSLYRGDFMPLFAYEKWVVPLAAYYRSMYFRAVHSACELLLAAGRYAELGDICTKASEIDPFEEEVHRYYILSLVRRNKTNAALLHYNYVGNLFYREMGVRVSQEMRALYREIAGTLGSIQTDIEVIKEELGEKDAAAGAFFCEYEVFRCMYRVEARAAARTGQTVFVGLLTVTESDGRQPSVAKLARVMDEMRETIRVSLRKGDVFSRFSATQYILMLPTLTFENGEMVLERICRRYRNEYRSRNVRITESLQPLDPIL